PRTLLASSPPHLFLLFLLLPRPPRSTLFPYTTLFRSVMFPRRIFLRDHPRHRFRVRLRHRRLQRLQPVLRSRNQRRKRIIPHDSRVIGRRQFLLFRGLPDRSEHPQRVIRLAVQRIAVHERSQSRSSRPFVPSRGVVKIADAIISLRQHF